MALGILRLGGITANGTGSSSSIPVAVDVPAGSLIFLIIAYSSYNYDQPTLTDSAGNSYQGNYVENCLPLSAGQSIVLHHERGPVPADGEGLMLVAYAYAITGSEVIRDSQSSTMASPGPAPGATANLSLGVGTMNYPRAFVALAEVDVSLPLGAGGAATPSSPASGWDLGSALGVQRQYNRPLVPSNGSIGMLDASRLVGAGATATWDASATAPSNSQFTAFGVGWYSFRERYPPSPDVSQARDTGVGRLLVAYTDPSGAVKVNRYNGNLPPEVEEMLPLEPYGGTGVSLQARGDNWFTLYYACRNEIRRRISTDGGRSWSMAVTVTTGYQDVVHIEDPARKLELVALWRESESRWYLRVGTLQADGTYDNYSPLAVLANNALRGGSLLREPHGVFAFAYRSTSDVVTIVRCSKLSKAGVGSWS